MNEVESHLESVCLNDEKNLKSLQKQLSEKESELARYKKMLVQSTKTVSYTHLTLPTSR